MKTAQDIMTPNPITTHPETSISDAVKVLLEKGFNGMPVVDSEGKLMGIICQSDLVAQQQRLELPSVFTLLDGFIPLPGWKKAERAFEKMSALTVGEAMTKNPVSITPETGIDEVASLMVKAKYYSLPVLHEGKVVGIVGKEDILRTLI